MTDTATDKRKPGFFQIDNEVIELYKLTPYSGWLYCTIVKHASLSGEAFPSINTLAELASMSKPTVIKNLAELEKRNLIKVKRGKINSKKNAVNHYFVQGVVKKSDLEYLEAVNLLYQGGKSPLPGVVNDVDRNKTHVNKTQEKEKNIPPQSVEGADSGFDAELDALKEDVEWLPHRTSCPDCDELYAEHDDGEQPITPISKLNSGVLEDHNLPGAEITPLIPDDQMPERTGTRLVEREITPIAQTNPANIQAETVETKTAMPETVPEEATKKGKKAKPKYTKAQRDAMKVAVLDAVGWQESDVNHWGRIQKVVTTLLNKGATVELLANWRDWNSNLECGKVKNPEGITGNGWPNFMKFKREQSSRPARKQPQELNIEVDEEFLD